ncbi:type IV CRISPR-associated protein Csf3 [Acidovorax sp.]|uniref:type IV CRISPR-associated protein Csf3 n=1 Tax=Acidovorax sp. TaxID=1872122 RepID=UPI00391F292F
MQALEVTFKLCSPVVLESDYPTHLDGLLAASVAEEAQEFGSDTPWQDADDLSHLLERTDADSTGAWVWKASALRFTPATERFFTSIVRRCEPEAFMHAMDSGVMNMRRPRNYLSGSGGQDRGYFLLHSYQWMESATAWCIGDANEIQAALQRIRYLGKMGRNGFGMVESFSVAPGSNTEAWRRRFLPVGLEGEGDTQYEPATRRLHAPYWKKTGLAQVKAPVFI